MFRHLCLYSDGRNATIIAEIICFHFGAYFCFGFFYAKRHVIEYDAQRVIESIDVILVSIKCNVQMQICQMYTDVCDIVVYSKACDQFVSSKFCRNGQILHGISKLRNE